MVVLETGLVVMANVAEADPAGTKTVAGAVTLLELDESATVNPPVGAFPVKVTVPVEDDPPITEVGETVTLAKDVVTVSVEATVAKPEVAAMVAAVVAETVVVVILKEVEMAPAGTVTYAGTPAAGLELDKVTMSPPVGAALDNVTVPRDPIPPTTEVGLTVNPITGTEP